MQLHFDEGYKFQYDGEEWEIEHIDFSDDEYPYECYPLAILDKAEEIADSDDCMYSDFTEVLEEVFIDERICFSEYQLMQFENEALQKEIESLKAEIKQLKGQ